MDFTATLTAEDFAYALCKEPMRNLPLEAYEYAKFLCGMYGMCGEVFVTAFAHYGYYRIGLKPKDSLYKIDIVGLFWFSERDK